MAGIGDYIKGKSFSEMFKKKSPLEKSSPYKGKKGQMKLAKKWSDEDEEEGRQQSMMTGSGRGHLNE